VASKLAEGHLSGSYREKEQNRRARLRSARRLSRKAGVIRSPFANVAAYRKESVYDERARRVRVVGAAPWPGASHLSSTSDKPAAELNRARISMGVAQSA
jgi:hypothetical protein